MTKVNMSLYTLRLHDCGDGLLRRDDDGGGVHREWMQVYVM
jgi:hypothetical protein